jgi:phospholipid/cholesterol/gamma-HCH transport system permease protein
VTTVADPQPVPPPPPRDEGVQISGQELARVTRAAVTTGGEIARFSARTVRLMPDMRRHIGEVANQATILVLSSGLIIWFMQFVVGTMCGTEASYTLKQIGAPLYSGVFTSYCGLREMAPYMWAYILAAKVGCGLVAELGSMRISDEIDAMEVMGVHSLSYLVGTRIAAAWIAMPFLFLVGLGLMYLSMYLTVVVMIGGVSSGGYLYTFWLYQNPYDLVGAMIKMMSMGTVVVFVGCYYGYTARGGPVGVGRATARSMMLNMVLIHVVGMICSWLFWGVDPNAPVAN